MQVLILQQLSCLPAGGMEPGWQGRSREASPLPGGASGGGSGDFAGRIALDLIG